MDNKINTDENFVIFDDDNTNNTNIFEQKYIDLQKKYDELNLKYLDSEKIIKDLQKQQEKNDLKKNIKDLQKQNYQQKQQNHKNTGFAKLRPVPCKLATFIGVVPGTELSGPVITKKVWSELKSRNLTFQGDENRGLKSDQRVLRVDDEVSKIFNIPMSVNNSVDSKDPNGFNFGNLQKYIRNAFISKK